MKRFYFPKLIVFITILSGWNSSVFAQTTFAIPNVPGCSGVSGVIVTMRGGGGGTSNSAGTGFPDGGAGGLPGAITCTLNVITPTMITSLTYYVGMVGVTGNPVLTGTSGVAGGAGYGRGGNSGNFTGVSGGPGTDVPGGGGGGSSAVLNTTGAVALLVAGGGGGGGALAASVPGGNGGNPGTAGGSLSPNFGGAGGTPGVGGAAGGIGMNYNGIAGGALPTGNGGNGGEGLIYSQSGGGGGAGWGGGGGGGAGDIGATTYAQYATVSAAGGGGSNYVCPTCVTTGLTNGTATVGGNGIVTLALYPAAIGGTCISLCPGATTTFTETTAGGVWSSSNAAIASVSATTGSPITVTAGTTAGTANISYTEPSGYYAFVTVTVLAPTPPITGPTSVCVGQTIALSDGISGGAWSSGTIGVATVNAATGVVTGVSAGTATITYTPTASCPVTTTITVTTSPGPITGATSVCTGSTITLSNTLTGGTWTSSNSSVATIDPATGVVSGVAPGTTTIGYTLGGSCFVTAIITVNQIAPVTGTTTICLGNTTILSDAVTGGTWSSGSPAVATIGASSGMVYSVAGGTATMTYTSPGGCTATANVTVNPNAPITGVTTICAGNPTTLSDAATPGTWSSSNPGVATINSTGDVTSVSGGTTTITFFTLLGCSATTTVTVIPQPVISSFSSTNPTTCGGTDGTITLNGLTSGASYSVNYDYNGAPAATLTITANGGAAVLINVPSTGLLPLGTYTNIQVTNTAGGCQSNIVGPITLYDPPIPPPPVITSNQPLCEHQTLLLGASDSLQGGTYSWTGPDEFTSSIQNPSVVGATVINTGTYTVIYSLLNCLSSTSADIGMAPPLVLTNVTLSQTISYGTTIQLNADNALYYRWTPDDGTLSNPNINNPVAAPLITTTYEVYGITLYGCLDSAFVTITVDSTMDAGIPSAFTPNGDGLNDVFRPVGIKFQRLVDFRVYNRWGQQVFYSNDREKGWDGTYNGAPQDIGTYFYQVIVARPGGTGDNIVYKGDVTLVR